MVAFEALEAKYGNFHVPRFKLEIKGETIEETDGRITDLSITTALDRANRVSFTLNDIFDHKSATFEDVDWDVFKEGNTAKAWVTYGDADETQLFKGMIDSVKPSFPAGSAPSVSVSAQDLRRKMRVGSSSDSWDERKLSDVVSGITGNYNFRDEVVEGADEPLQEKKDLKLKKLINNADSDYAFLSELARAHGFELFSRGGVFHFREPKREASPVTTLTYGRSLNSFQPGEPGGEGDVGTVEVRHWNEHDAEAIVGTASRDDGELKEIRRIPVESEDEAIQRAEAILDQLTKPATSRGQAVGLPELQIGRTVEIAGLGSFSGPYYIEEATHRIDQSGYTTSLTVTEATSA